jgi:Ca2+-binding RTX toxin-like protein
MALITPQEVTNWFLYGQSTRPTNLVSDALIRANPLPLSQKPPVPDQNMNEFMKTGPGRFAKGASIELVDKFFTTDFIFNSSAFPTLEYGRAYDANQMSAILGGVVGFSKDVIVTQSLVRDNVDDWAARSYIFNTGSYTINTNASNGFAVPKFIVYANGEKRIQDFSVRAYDDSFDFDGALLTNYGNILLGDAVDPSEIGRKVEIEIRGEVSPTIYDLDRDGYYDVDDFYSELATMRTWDQGAYLLPILLPKIESLVTGLWNDGTIKFLDAQNRPIIYGTNGADNLNDNSFGETYLRVPHIEDYVQNGVVLIGGKGNDVLTGGGNGDSLLGGEGNDTLDGGSGNDTLEGGDGNDTYILSGGNDTIDDDGSKDVIRGFSGTAVETETDSGIYELGGATITKAGGSLLINDAGDITTILNWADNDNTVCYVNMKIS